MPDAQFLDRILSSTSQLLGAGHTAASFAPIPYLPGIFTALDAIVGTIQVGFGVHLISNQRNLSETQTMRGNKESFKGLVEDATGLITILVYWAAKGFKHTPEIEASVKDLHGYD